MLRVSGGQSTPILVWLLEIYSRVYAHSPAATLNFHLAPAARQPTSHYPAGYLDKPGNLFSPSTRTSCADSVAVKKHKS